ncbi:MAG: alpha/beta fold hydrolase, partial [Chloroflexi bacterium]|nr:alpha/beta fold hydrolase [Chloroflexota bacterium]
MSYAAVNGINLYYESYGEGEPLILAHGADGNALSWWQQVPVFARRYRVIVFDHRGFYRSPDLPDGPNRAAHCDDLRGLLDALGIERA